jgi:aspartate-semialdehyde dehydrogenase
MSALGNESLRLAIVGATGAVGGQLLELIEERAFPYADLKLFSSEEHDGESIESHGEVRGVLALSDPGQLSDSDVVFLAVKRAVAQEILGEVSGPIVVDISAAALVPGNVPFVAPGFTTREQVREHSRFKLFHTPHPTAHALATLISALDEKPFYAATLMLGASSVGHSAISHLVEQTANLLNGRLEVGEDERQGAFNLAPFPQASELESALAVQVAKLIGRTPHLVLQSVQVPILHGSAISMSILGAAAAGSWAESLRAAPGILLIENEEPPTVVDAIGQEALLVSLAGGPAGAALWCVFDNARRAALAALWIAECLVGNTAEKLN